MKVIKFLITVFQLTVDLP